MKKIIIPFLMASIMAIASGCSAFNSISQPQIGQRVSLDMKVFQVLSQHSALARTKGSGLFSYIGDAVLMISETGVVYDDLILHGSYVLVGTYTYETSSGIIKTVPAFMSNSEYKILVSSGREIESVFSFLDH